MYWLVKTSDGTLLQLAETNSMTGLSPDRSFLTVPEGVAPGNCKVVDGALVAMAEDESKEVQNTNPYWAQLRADRNARLLACDWRLLADYSGNDVAAWVTYRTALKNVPQNAEDPAAPTWPETP